MRILVLYADDDTTDEHMLPLIRLVPPAVGTILEDLHPFGDKTTWAQFTVTTVYDNIRDGHVTLEVDLREVDIEGEAFKDYLRAVWFSSEEEKKQVKAWAEGSNLPMPSKRMQ